jgi:hypothetical protein
MSRNGFDNDYIYDWVIKKTGGTVPQSNNGVEKQVQRNGTAD